MDKVNDKLLILGAGGHGKVVAEAAKSMQQWNEICFLDDKPIENYPYKIIGDFASLEKWKTDFSQVVIALGDGKKRAYLLQRCEQQGFALATIIHSCACVSSSAIVGSGSVVFAQAVVNAGAVIGDGCIINSAAVIEHDCVIGNYTHISPNAALAGGVKVDEYSWVGIGSSVIELIVIGKNVIVGAGSVVIDNIQDNCMVVGVPAKVIKKYEQ